jgi:hypothetical protein
MHWGKPRLIKIASGIGSKQAASAKSKPYLRLLILNDNATDGTRNGGFCVAIFGTQSLARVDDEPEMRLKLQ